MSSPYVIGDLPGYTPQIARLIGMMTYVRETTISAVQGLTTAQLDHVQDENANSIGALLMHIAAVESAYQASTFGVPDDMQRWQAALNLGTQARDEIRGHPLEHYLDTLREVRERTLRELAKRDDKWLMAESSFRRGQAANNYFKWFHVFEDELNHRGQIRWLVKRLP
ncbi:MAG TPA: DinB family protein [Thermoanaerobaculia bacterium]